MSAPVLPALSPGFRAWLIGSLLLALLAPAAWAQEILRFDPALDRLIAPGTQVEKLSDGHQWIEGPVWLARDNALLFTDIPLNRVLKLVPGSAAEIFLERSGYTGAAPFAGKEPGANGLTLDAQGRLVLAEHGDRRIARLETDGRKTTLADRYLGRRLNSPNDLVHDARGNLYFTDPPFGLPGTFTDTARELDFCGVYRLSANGELRLLTKQLEAPNGIALSPDEKTLYVTDVGERRPAWWRFTLREDGALGMGELFRNAEPFRRNGAGGPDGLKLDREGNVFASGPGGVYVFDVRARLLGRIALHSATSNLGWGEDGRTLFVTAGHTVYRLRTLTRAAHLPGPPAHAAQGNSS